MNNNKDLFGGIESGLYMICRICGAQGIVNDVEKDFYLLGVKQYFA